MFGRGWMESNTYFSTHGFLQNNHRLTKSFKTKGYELVMSLLDGNNDHKWWKLLVPSPVAWNCWMDITTTSVENYLSRVPLREITNKVMKSSKPTALLILECTVWEKSSDKDYFKSKPCPLLNHNSVKQRMFEGVKCEKI